MKRKRKIDKLYRGTVTDILKDNSLELSPSGLEKLIDDELKKGEEMDPDLIEFYIDTISKIRDTGNISITIIESDDDKGKISFKGIKRVISIIAAIFLLACVTLSAYAAVFNVNLIDEFVEFYNEYIVIRFDKSNNRAEEYKLLGSELAQELNANGISPVLLPSVILSDEAEIISIDYQKTDAINLANITFVLGKEKGNLIISQYLNNAVMPEVTYPNAKDVVSLNVSELTVFVFKQNGDNTITYQDAFTQYFIVLSTNHKQTIEIAESIK